MALGLARIVSGTFPGWGPDFSALAAGVVLMNLFTGPPLFKVASTGPAPLPLLLHRRTLRRCCPAPLFGCQAQMQFLAVWSAPCATPAAGCGRSERAIAGLWCSCMRCMMRILSWIECMRHCTSPAPSVQAAVIAVGEARAIGLPAMATEFDSG